MIPLKDYNPTASFPHVTVIIILLNLAVFAFDRLTGSYGTMPVETPHGAMMAWQFTGGLSRHFALIPAVLTTHFTTAWSTIFVSMFLHGNWLHVGSNMLYLWIFGDNIEDRLGKARFLLFYLLCGGCAAAAQVASDPLSSVPMVGASGAVAGVMGAYLLLYPRAMVLTLVPIIFFFTFFDLPAFLIIGYWGLIQFLNAVLLEGGGELRGGGVAYFAHLGGFIAGMALVFPMGRKKSVRRGR